MKVTGIKNQFKFEDFAINGYSENSKAKKAFDGEFPTENLSVTDGRKAYDLSADEIALHGLSRPEEPATSTDRAVMAYSRSMSIAEQIKVYADEQLLSNPGGDRYDEESEDGLYKGNHDSPANRLRKDLSDALANLRNFFLDFTTGSTFRYRNDKGKIEKARNPGLLSSVGNFFKHFLSGITFGAYVPEGENRPSGFANRLVHFFKSLYKAVVGDGIEGVLKSANHMAEDLTLAAWNAAETVPDATIGNLPGGRRAVTTLFDTGQVVLDYISDVAPGGEAWDRVHSGNIFKGEVPFVTNLTQPPDSRRQPWNTVRNTPFRKIIETLGCLAVDILGFFSLKRFFTNSGDSGDRR